MPTTVAVTGASSGIGLATAWPALGVRPGLAALVGMAAMFAGASHALLASVVVPFIKMEAPYTEFKELIAKIWEVWDEHGESRERIGEMIVRIGKGNFIEEVGLEPLPSMIKEPRSNPYIFYEEFFEEEEGA